MKNDDDYKVGFGKPPKHTRFKKGESGNPKGRPKKKNTVSIVMENVADEEITIREGNKIRRLTKLEVLIQQHFNDAMKGKSTACKNILSMLNDHDQRKQIEGKRLEECGVLLIEPPPSKEAWIKAATKNQEQLQKLMQNAVGKAEEEKD